MLWLAANLAGQFLGVEFQLLFVFFHTLLSGNLPHSKCTNKRTDDDEHLTTPKLPHGRAGIGDRITPAEMVAESAFLVACRPCEGGFPCLIPPHQGHQLSGSTKNCLGRDFRKGSSPSECTLKQRVFKRNVLDDDIPSARSYARTQPRVPPQS